MKRVMGLLCLIWVTAPAGGEEKVRGKDQRVLHYPFGSVAYVPQAEKLADESVEKGKLHARTEGVFKVSYELVRDKDEYVARRVTVRVVNREEYLSPATPELRDHEAVHRHINETEAARMEKELGAFRVKENRADQAKKKFKAEFQKQINAVKKRHADWDDTQVFLKPAPPNDYK
jgi:hypothetical protein